ncbi:hypothetical protein M5K25_000632 [Dendrobium thyrsiflorum]|uniref:Uncharacterized protein n=1 Tax=Dendrobium thyrsiflorum TaxID=117978 RepID=A0ABD0W9C4_DENTH
MCQSHFLGKPHEESLGVPPHRRRSKGFDYSILLGKVKRIWLLCHTRGKPQTQKAFWTDSALKSSKQEAEEEVTNLHLMGNDNLDQSDQDEIKVLYLLQEETKGFQGSLPASGGSKKSLGSLPQREIPLFLLIPPRFSANPKYSFNRLLFDPADVPLVHLTVDDHKPLDTILTSISDPAAIPTPNSAATASRYTPSPSISFGIFAGENDIQHLEPQQPSRKTL